MTFSTTNTSGRVPSSQEWLHYPSPLHFQLQLPKLIRRRNPCKSASTEQKTKIKKQNQNQNMGLLSHLLLLLFLLCTIPAESADPSFVFCNENTNITRNQISANIDGLLPQLVEGTIQNGFIATSNGRGQDQVYGLAQCRADVGSKDCSSCIQDAAKEIRKRCPNQADARLVYEYCLLRYDIKNFFGEVDTSYGIIYYNVENVTDPETFNRELGALSDKISSDAIVQGNKGNGRGKTKLTPFLTLYALVQCTRDLSPQPCSQCLSIAIGNNFPTICGNKKGCRVIYSSCFVRYELYPFYFPLDSQDGSANASTANYVSVVFKP